MAEETQTNTEVEQDAGGESNGETVRLRSTIGFPYGDLEDAVTIARTLHDSYGGTAALDQLAAALGTTTKSGSFRLRMATARTFGVVEGRGTVSLSQLGRQIVDPATEAQARAEAFLRVPLYQLIHEEHRGGTLPGDRGLEAKMSALGVSKKQVAKARQAFQRSAEQAGFFRRGKDRLVMPAGGGSASSLPEQDAPPKPPKPEIDGFDDHDPLIVGLFRKLPPPNAQWSEPEQEKWLELAKHILPAVYGSGD